MFENLLFHECLLNLSSVQLILKYLHTAMNSVVPFLKTTSIEKGGAAYTVTYLVKQIFR